MAAPTFVDVATASGSSGTVVITIPATVASGDVMLLGAFSQLGTEPTEPAGWTSITTSEGGPVSGVSAGLAVYRRTAMAGDLGGATTVTLTFGTADIEVAILVAYRGADPTPDTSGSQGGAGAPDRQMLAQFYTTTVVNDRIVTFYGAWSIAAVANSLTMPATGRGGIAAATHAGLGVADQVEPTATTNAPLNGTETSTGPYGTITVALKPATPATPAITSGNSFSVPATDSFFATISTTGTPLPAITETGSLPSGVTLSDHGDGTASLHGTATVVGVYPFTLHATNTGGTANQSFTLTVTPAPLAPTFTSATGVNFTTGRAGTFSVVTTGAAAITLTEVGTLPSGVTFVDNGSGLGTIAGTPTGAGFFTVTLTATNFVNSTDQTFSVQVQDAVIPSFTSGSGVTFVARSPGSFDVSTSGSPDATLTETGLLPSGVTFVDNGGGEGTLAGTPAVAGSFAITFTAANTEGSVNQSFLLVVSPGAVVVQQWTLYDPQTTETYSFEINPSSGGIPPLSKLFAFQSMSGSDGGLVAMESQPTLIPIQFAGTILSEAQYNALNYWFTKGHAVVLTDDLGLVSTIYITGFTPKRVRTASYPWHHDYTCDALMIRAGA